MNDPELQNNMQKPGERGYAWTGVVTMGSLRLGGRTLAAFLACVSGVSNTCIHAWPIYDCIGSCLHIDDPLMS